MTAGAPGHCQPRRHVPSSNFTPEHSFHHITVSFHNRENVIFGPDKVEITFLLFSKKDFLLWFKNKSGGGNGSRGQCVGSNKAKWLNAYAPESGRCGLEDQLGYLLAV